MSCTVMIGCIVMTPARFEVAAPGMKKPGGPNPGAPKSPSYCEMMGGVVGAEGTVVCGLEV